MGKYLASPIPDSIIFAASRVFFFSSIFTKGKGEEKIRKHPDKCGYMIPDAINCRWPRTKTLVGRKMLETRLSFKRVLGKPVGEKLIPLKKRKFGIGEQRNVPP